MIRLLAYIMVVSVLWIYTPIVAAIIFAMLAYCYWYKYIEALVELELDPFYDADRSRPS